MGIIIPPFVRRDEKLELVKNQGHGYGRKKANNNETFFHGDPLQIDFKTPKNKVSTGRLRPENYWR